MADKKQITLQIKAEVREAEKRLKKLINNQKEIKKQNDGLKKSFVGLGKTIVSAFAVQALANYSKQSLVLKARADSLTKAFTNLGQGIGLNEKSLEKFRKATDGTVSDIDLMIQANNAMLLGIVQNENEFAELIDSAQRLAKAVGKDTLFGIESLTTGIGRQSRLMLDNLGIIVKAEDAYKAMAQATGKSVAALTDLERKQAFITATMESVRSKVANLGQESLDTNDSIAQLDVAMENLQLAFGEFMEGPGVSFINFLTTGVSSIQNFTEDVANLVDEISNFPNRLQQAFDSIGAEQEPLLTYDNFVGPLQPTGEEKVLFDTIKDNYHEHMEAMKGIDGDYQQAKMNMYGEELIVLDALSKRNEDATRARRKLEKDAHREKIAQNLESAILQGQSAKEAGLSVIKAEVAEAQAGLISSIMKALPFPINLAVAAGAGGMIGKVTDSLFSSFATGGSIITKGRTTLPIGGGVVAGDNASGMERIDFTPLPAPPGANDRNITINISAPLVDETVVDHIIPAIRRAEKLNL